MITNHGIHDWDIRSGLIDTGGQNHYVNALSDTLVSMEFRVTTCNRGGFPDPVGGRFREGASYKNDSARILYLCGGGARFIRKEYLNREILSEEASFASDIFSREGARFDLLISHYWDGAVLGHLLREKMGWTTKHVWIPHSLGALKRANFAGKPQAVIASCRFEERIKYEKDILKNVDAVASTSGDITKTLADFYGRRPELFLPPCIDTAAIRPMERKDCNDIYSFLAEQDPLTGRRVKGRSCLLEVSRTDRTKRKDVVIRAFARLAAAHPDLMLLLTLSPDGGALYSELMQLLRETGIRDRTVVIGTIPRGLMPELYALADVYCSPSEMEGFGMSVQEACASGCAAVASDLVPFAVEYLLPGDAGLVVKAGDVPGFANAISRLLDDAAFRKETAAKAYAAVIPYFTWPSMTRRMLRELGMPVLKDT